MSSADRQIVLHCGAAAEEAASALLFSLGAQGVASRGARWPVPGVADDREERDDGLREVSTVVPAAQAATFARSLRRLVGERIEPHFGAVRVEVREAPSRDWIRRYREEMRCQRIDEDFAVAPPWDLPRDVAQVLVVDPGAAFGTGDHGSTRSTLRAMRRVLRPGDDVIDLGSGTGVLGAAAMRFGAGRLRAYDVDPLAVQATRRTLRRNRIRGRTLRSSLPQRARPCDLLVANMTTDTLLPFAGRFAAVLRPGGRLVAGGLLRGDERLPEALAREGLRVTAREVDGVWQAVACARAGV